MIKRIISASVALAASCMLAPPAHAGCGIPDAVLNNVLSTTPALSTATNLGVTNPEGSIKNMMQTLHEQGTLTEAHSASRNLAIVGMWHFTYISEGNQGLGIPDGAILDNGFQTWHSDGTELTNSLRPPTTNSFCMGVWDYYGVSGYRLNHYALGWDTSGTVFIGPVNIREQVKVDTSGKTLTGTFTVDQYAADGMTLLVHLQGNMTGTRINVD